MPAGNVLHIQLFDQITIILLEFYNFVYYFGHGKKYITYVGDTTAPSISNVTVTDVSSTGYPYLLTVYT